MSLSLSHSLRYVLPACFIVLLFSLVTQFPQTNATSVPADNSLSRPAGDTVNNGTCHARSLGPSVNRIILRHDRPAADYVRDVITSFEPSRRFEAEEAVDGCCLFPPPNHPSFPDLFLRPSRAKRYLAAAAVLANRPLFILLIELSLNGANDAMRCAASMIRIVQYRCCSCNM